MIDIHNPCYRTKSVEIAVYDIEENIPNNNGYRLSERI